MRNKRGVSPVVATVLLIAIVVVLALIIFLWAKGFVKETVMKKGESAKNSCSKIRLELSYSGGTLQATNIGNIPLYGLEIKKQIGRSIEIQREQARLPAGQSKDIEIAGNPSEIKVYPVVLGLGGSGKHAYVCSNYFSA